MGLYCTVVAFKLLALLERTCARPEGGGLSMNINGSGSMKFNTMTLSNVTASNNKAGIGA